MKKLMFAAAVATVGASAFSAPLVYDYKASTKQMNLKETTVTVGKAKIPVYMKYLTSGSLKGYLIVDQDGATSDNIQKLSIAAGATVGNATPATCPWDYGRNRAFLVVQNSKADKAVRAPKIIPSVLDAKWIQTKLTATSGIAEGYLYSGGEFKAGQVREALDIYNKVHDVTRNAVAAAGFIQDYCWTSIYLFGQYNGPLFMTGVWDNAETDIDGAQDTDLQQPFAAGKYFFHDTWMNGAGFGKWVSNSPKVKKPCCGMPAAKVTTKVLDSLSGNLKGGLFLCTENLTSLETGYVTINNQDWEDQFFCCRDHADSAVGKWVTAEPADQDQTDLWQDGGLELNTRDCISGTWSIKLTAKLVEQPLTAVEKNRLFAATVEDAVGLDTLWANIKGAALKLKKDTLITNGDEIWNTATAWHDEVPFVTPQFCKYYGLANYVAPVVP